MPRIQLLPVALLSVQCSRNCSGGFKVREVQCMDGVDHHRSLRPFHCQFLAGVPPPLSMSCNLEPCEEWKVEPWSQVCCPVGTHSISETESDRPWIVVLTHEFRSYRGPHWNHAKDSVPFSDPTLYEGSSHLAGAERIPLGKWYGTLSTMTAKCFIRTWSHNGHIV